MLPVSRRTSVRLAAGGAISMARPSIAAGNPIDDSAFVRIGDLDQWIGIQGRVASNPVVLYLHGGPGEAQSPFLTQFLPWEQDFTIVNWDQRGSGKTYGRNGALTPEMTLARIASDAIELATLIRARLSQRKLILVGQSWGSFLGMHVAKKRPDLFHAFVGTGQFVSFAATLKERVAWARQQATAEGDQIALKVLDTAATLPTEHRVLAEVTASKKWTMSPPDLPYAKMIAEFTGGKPQAGKNDVTDWTEGTRFSASKLSGEIMTRDLRRLGLEMQIPTFVIQGREDHISGFDSVKDYVDDMRAPRKAFVAIDGGHFACFTHAEQFVAAMREHVLPLTK